MLYREDARLAELRAASLLDTEPDARLERIASIARRLFSVPIALVSLVDKERQWFKTVQGLDTDQTDRCVSFCAHAIRNQGTFVVEDASEDDRFAHNELVTTDPHLRFYAGQPLLGPSGQPIGTFCILDRKPRDLGDQDAELFRSLARWVQSELDEIMGSPLSEREYRSALIESNGFLAAVLDSIPSEMVILDGEGVILAGNRAWGEFSTENGGQPPYLYLGESYLEPSKGDPLAHRGILDVIEGKVARFTHEYPCDSRTESRWFRMDVLRLAWGGPTRILVRHDDITEKKRQTEREADALRASMEADAALREADQHRRILNSVSHHLRTPLTPLKMRLASLRKMAPEQAATVQKAENDVLRLETVIERVTRAVEVEGLTRLRLREDSWQSFWPRLWDGLKRDLPADRFEVEIKGDGNIRVDVDWMRRAVRELLRNALAVEPDDRRIKIDFAMGRRGTITIHDHGPGISDEALKGMANPFSGVQGEEDRGMGLGLYLAARVARLHGGGLEGKRVKDGTKMVLSLPRVRLRPARSS